jgi:alpha-1,3-rhamnosyl/mannosyltransferase
MKIAIDVREATGKPAGKGRYVLELVQALARLNSKHQFYLYASTSFDWGLPDNFHARVLAPDGLNWHRRLAQECRREGIDVYLATLSYLGAIFAQVPSVLVIHDLAVFQRQFKSRAKSKLVERLTLRPALKKAAKIIAVSHFTASELGRYAPRVKNKLSVVPLAASEAYRVRTSGEYATRLQGKFGLKNKGYILFTGTIEPRKNIETLLAAYARLPMALRSRYPLVIAGRRGWDYEPVFATLEALGLGNQVKFLDYVANEDLPLLFNGAALFAFPSFYEGFGLPVLEAMQSGLPVVTSNAGTLLEVGGQAALTSEPTDEVKMADNIRRVLEDEPLRAELIQKSLGQARQFSWEKTARQTLEVLESLKRA